MKKFLLKCIRTYRETTLMRNPRCRYIPSCSEYAQKSIEDLGVKRGLWLFMKRLLRCHPFGSHGYDPVPEK